MAPIPIPFSISLKKNWVARLQIKWNFTKFLSGPEGKPLKGSPTTVPKEIICDIKKVLDLDK
jgi:glutathione peroxidase-family protein